MRIRTIIGRGKGMNDKGRIEMLKSVVNQLRAFDEEKKAVNEELHAKQKEIEEEIMSDGKLSVAKKKYLQVLEKERERKELNAKMKRLKVAMEKIIMGEDQYDSDQMTIEDIIDGADEEEEPEIDNKSLAAGE